MAKRKQDDGFNLSFLDVMACGLGAVLMILILVKFQANTSIPKDEVEKLEKELAAQAALSQEIEARIDSTNQALQQAVAADNQVQQQIAALDIIQRATQQALADKQAVIADWNKPWLPLALSKRMTRWLFKAAVKRNT